MLCQECWLDHAPIRFWSVDADGASEEAVCLACAQHHPLSWLLTWGYTHTPVPGGRLPSPVAVRAAAAGTVRTAPHTLLATGLHQCPCGCRIVTAAAVPCRHGDHAFEPGAQAVRHACHCGVSHLIGVPGVVCRECGAIGAGIVATAHTCTPPAPRPAATAARRATAVAAHPPRWI